MSETVWYKQFFEEAYPQTQRRKPGRPEAEREVDFLIRELGLAPGMRVLDLCCGSGYNAIPLARRGLHVVGLDLSERMLGEAVQAGRDAGVTVEWTQADMRDIKWNRAFDAVINMDNSFGYLPDDGENFRVLEGVARALVPGGRFCLHVASYPFLLRHWHARVWHTGDGGWYRLESNKLDLLQSSIDVHCILIRPDGSQSEMNNRLRLFAPHELLAWLRRAGFSRIRSYGDLAGTPFSLETPGLVMVGETDRP